MPGPAGYLLNLPTLVLLGWQPVSDFMPDPARCLSLCSTPLWSCWLNSMWVISCQIWLGPFWLSSLPLWICWLVSLWVISCQVQLGTFWISPLWSCWVDSEWVISYQIYLGVSHCAHSHFGPIGFIECKWFHVRSGWVSSDCPHSHSGHVDLLVCESFHARSSWVHSDSLTSTLVLLAWQKVSDWMPDPVGWLLIVLTLILILLA